jgi:hypothetical protein
MNATCCEDTVTMSWAYNKPKLGEAKHGQILLHAADSGFRQIVVCVMRLLL